MDSSITHGYRALLEPISAQQPCGIDLEYHPDLMVAQARAAAQDPAQYGSFVAPQEAVNWRELETLVLRLLASGRDIRALVFFLRCRIHLAGAVGAYQGLWLLAESLRRYPETLHPQRIIDGAADAALQANAIALLAESGMLESLRQMVIDRASATFLTVRDVERSLAVPRLPEAPDPASVAMQLRVLHERRHAEIAALAGCHFLMDEISAWAREALGDESPDLDSLTNLFSPFGQFLDEATVGREGEENLGAVGADDNVLAHFAVAPSIGCSAERGFVGGGGVSESDLTAEGDIELVSSGLPGRQQALAQIQAARRWFEMVEPSSPVADLLRQAERLTGKCYAEVADAIPMDLLVRWRRGE